MFDIPIAFVHTPIQGRYTPGRDDYWQAFNKLYYGFHPDSIEPQEYFLELPHWATWLAGVLDSHGFTNLGGLDLFSTSILNGIDYDSVRASLKYARADVYLFAPMTINIGVALKIAAMIKELYPAALTVFGGIFATPMHLETAAHSAVDVIIRDRGDYALPELLKAYVEKRDLRTVGNVTITDEQGTYVSPKLHPYIETNLLPYPKVDIFPSSTGKKMRYIRQNWSLGCPWACSFCTIQTIGRKPQYFSSDRVLTEVMMYREQFGHHHHVYFGDETFTTNSKATTLFCEHLAEEQLFEFDCQTRLPLIQDPALPKILYDAGCRWIEIGLESIHAFSLQYKKQRKVAPMLEAFERLRDAGIGVCTYTMYGLPSESLDDMKRTMEVVSDWIRSDILTTAFTSILVPYPGTEFFATPMTNGLEIITTDFSLYDEDLLPVFRTASFSEQELYDVFLLSIQSYEQAMRQKHA